MEPLVPSTTNPPVLDLCIARTIDSSNDMELEDGDEALVVASGLGGKL